MPFTKDLIIATTVLVGCGLVLFLTLSEPSRASSGTVDVPGAPELAMGDRPTPPPPDEPPSPPGESGGFSGSGSSLDFGVFDQPVEPEPPRGTSRPGSTAGSSRPGAAASPGGASSPALAATPGSSGSANPFSDLGIAEPTPGPQPDPIARAPQPAPGPIAAAPLPSARPAAAPGAAGSRSHTVASGETLMDISFKFFGTHHKWREIAAANQVDPDALVVGTVLQIPELAAVVPASAQGSTRADGSYVVQKGDSYYTIARDLLGDSSRFQELVRMNSIDPYDLMPGDVIKLPAGARAPSAGVATPSVAVSQPRDLPAGGRWHVVAEGEILGDISSRYYGTAKRWREIADANGISDPTALKAGQKLVIPGAGGSGSGSSASSTPRASSQPAASGRGAGSWYTVQKGDLLETIAKRQLGDGGKWRAIVEANPGLDPRRLKVGEKIWIPGASAAPSALSPVPSASPSRSSGSSSSGGGAISWPDLDSTPRSGSGGGGGSSSPFDRIVP